MDNSNERTWELSSLVTEAGKKLAEDYCYRFFDFLNSVGLSEADGPAPLEIWAGIAQGLADASGYRVVLQAEILQPIRDNMLHSIGQREIANLEPTLFAQRAPEE